LGVAMICFMFSITNTSAAITLLCLAANALFFTALLAFLFFKREKIFFKMYGISNKLLLQLEIGHKWANW